MPLIAYSVRGGQGSGKRGGWRRSTTDADLDDAKNGIAGGMMPAKADEG
jgi:hypothetical protein